MPEDSWTSGEERRGEVKRRARARRPRDYSNSRLRHGEARSLEQFLKPNCFSNLGMNRFSRMDKVFMGMALRQAKECFQRGEVPIGAVVVLPGGNFFAARGNAQSRLHDALAHAEIRALNAACYDTETSQMQDEDDTSNGRMNPLRAEKRLRRRLDGSTLFVTVEPCLMCLGACLLHHVDRVVFGARNLKFGAISGGSGCFNDSTLNLRSRMIDEACNGEGIQWPSLPVKKDDGGEQEPKEEEEGVGGGGGALTGQHYNHQFSIQGGCMGEESALLMKDFFKERRRKL